MSNTAPTPPPPTVNDLLQRHEAELVNVTARLYELDERRRELRSIVASLRAARDAVRSSSDRPPPPPEDED